MKRGLVVLDPAEIPDQEWDERIEGLRRSMTEHGVDASPGPRDEQQQVELSIASARGTGAIQQSVGSRPCYRRRVGSRLPSELYQRSGETCRAVP